MLQRGNHDPVIAWLGARKLPDNRRSVMGDAIARPETRCADFLSYMSEIADVPMLHKAISGADLIGRMRRAVATDHARGRQIAHHTGKTNVAAVQVRPVRLTSNLMKARQKPVVSSPGNL
jgi:hypothetical protein